MTRRAQGKPAQNETNDTVGMTAGPASSVRGWTQPAHAELNVRATTSRHSG
jgi:hypothetical protein